MADVLSKSSPLVRGLKVVGYILVSVIVSEVVVEALQRFLGVHIDDKSLVYLINVLLATLAAVVRDKLPKDNKLASLL